MTKPSLIVIHGAPASGKTLLGEWLADQLQVALLTKDHFKEVLFSHFDYEQVDGARRIDDASYEVLWTALERLMTPSYLSCIVETAFDAARSQPELLQLIDRHGYRVVQIYCHAAEPVLRQRYFERARSGQRHPGHNDLQNVEDQPIPETSPFRPMDLPGPLIDVDTTDLAGVDHESILGRLKQLLASDEPGDAA